jgi:hypothetical protein
VRPFPITGQKCEQNVKQIEIKVTNRHILRRGAKEISFLFVIGKARLKIPKLKQPLIPPDIEIHTQISNSNS